MAHKLAFEVAPSMEAGCYTIRLLDKRQIVALCAGEDKATRALVSGIPVYYDEGNGELVPVGGFDDATPQGRVAMKVLADVYCDALRDIAHLKEPGGSMTKTPLEFVFDFSESRGVAV